MGFTTPDAQHPLSLPRWSMRIVDEKLLQWKNLIEVEGATPEWGYERKLLRKETPPTGSFQTPNLFDFMNPPQYWKVLTECKAKEISWLDEAHKKNPRYWESKYRLFSDALETLQKCEYDWIGCRRNLCSSCSHEESDLISPSPSPLPSSPSQLPSSKTSIGPEGDGPSSALVKNRLPYQQTVGPLASQGVIRSDAHLRGRSTCRRSIRLAAKSAAAQYKPLTQSVREPELNSEPVKTLAGTKRKRDAFVSVERPDIKGKEEDIRLRLYPSRVASRLCPNIHKRSELE